MNRYVCTVLTLCLIVGSASASDCLRYFDASKGSVLKSCELNRPLSENSITAPELSFPNNISPIIVERVINPITIQVSYNYETQLIRLLGIKLPPEDTDAYKQALAYIKNLISERSVLYFENSGIVDTDRALLGYGWQQSNQLNLLLIEQGLAEYVPSQGGRYEEILKNAQEWAKSQKLGLWDMTK